MSQVFGFWPQILAGGCSCTSTTACPGTTKSYSRRSAATIRGVCKIFGQVPKVRLCSVSLHDIQDPDFISSLREAELVTPTIISGLQVYFDKSLGANLLYRFERPQYAQMRKQYITGPKVIIGQEKEMSAIYGAEHLLRMLGKVP